MQNEVNRLSIGKSAKVLGVSVDTLRRWQRGGRINSFRSPGGHRYFLKSDLESLLNKKYKRYKKESITIESSIARQPETVEKATGEIELKETKKIGQAFLKKALTLLLIFFAVMDLVLVTIYFIIKNTLFISQ